METKFLWYNHWWLYIFFLPSFKKWLNFNFHAFIDMSKMNYIHNYLGKHFHPIFDFESLVFALYKSPLEGREKSV